jgi:LexA-binding, inner membrane-associated putative hydrolase
MAGFKTHITTSSILGVGYGTVANIGYGVPLPACILAGGLCGLSGMLPDLDSASGVPKRESIAFGAAVIPLLLVERLKNLPGMQPEYLVICGGAVYLFIRFVLARMLTHMTVHRGMFHSFPACLIAGEAAFLLCGHEHPWEHYFNACAVMLGFMSHLVLDEIWALDFSGGRIRFKSSWGTAMKFWGESMPSNLLTYGLLGLSTLASLGDPELAKYKGPDETQQDQQQVANQPDSRQVQ